MPSLAIDLAHLQVLRDQHGLITDTALASAMRLHKGTVSRVLTGKAVPGPRFIAAAMHAFDVPFEYLFTATDSTAGVVAEVSA